MTRTAETDYFEPYDDLAVQVCSNTLPNTEAGINMNNKELSDEICELLDIDSFDLFDDLDPNNVVKSTDLDIVRAHAFLYFLRWQVFYTAQDADIGLKYFNEIAIAHSELWYIRLSELYVVLTGGEENKKWLN